VAWLEERLKADLGLAAEMIGRIDGGSVEADVKTRRLIDRWAVVSVKGGRVSGIEAIGEFIARVGLPGTRQTVAHQTASLLARRLRRLSMLSSPI
jgi:hypothetical protein